MSKETYERNAGKVVVEKYGARGHDESIVLQRCFQSFSI